MAEIKNVPVKDIIVNLNNPRFEQQADEESEMIKILTDKNRTFELMKDIAKHGVDPSELTMLVFDESLGKYVVMEGNRRLTSIKVLNNPRLVPSAIENRDKVLKKVHSIIKENNYEPIIKVPSVIYSEDDPLLKHFIELKHSGEKKGAGRVKWDTESKTRFDSTDTFRNYLLSFLKTVHPGIQDNFGLTTIERVLSDSVMRIAIGLIIDKKEPVIKFVDDFSKLKLYFILDGLLTKKFKVSDVYNKSNREFFAKKYLLNPLNQPWRNRPINTHPINPEAVDTPINLGTVDTPINSGAVDTPINSGAVDTPINPGAVDTPINPGAVDTPNNPEAV
ncbi:hypothetical protein, partial [Peribacillus sp. NPDC058002]|uniref:hypothetical protein n=1 Tax=Peribacillus sp. NPDC058002 TaxID=3346301 RepID=UPI0036DBD4EE